MKTKHLVIFLFILVIALWALYYPSFTTEEEAPAREVQPEEEPESFVISEEAGEIIEEVGGQEEAVISEEVHREEIIYVAWSTFSPKTVTVKEGTKVTWINKDVKVHQIKELSTDHLFRSERLDPGDRFSYTFDYAGEYRYIDTIYTYMSGKIIVRGAALTTVTGDVVKFSKNPANVTVLLLFIAFGLIIIYSIEDQKKS